jgi:type IV secretion system protein VirD4
MGFSLLRRRLPPVKDMAPPGDPEPKRGIFLGRYLNRETGEVGGELFYRGDRHLILFGPSRSGKGARELGQNLLRVRDRAAIVLDTKGELVAITGNYRMTIGRVITLDPLEVNGPSDGFNPLVQLDPASKLFVDDASAIAEALIKIEDKDPHWSESAEGLVTAFIMWEVVLAQRERRMPLLENVRRLLSEPDEFANGPGGRRLVRGLRVTAARMCVEGGFEIESLIGRFLRDTNEISSIQSTADRQTRWLLSPPIRDSLRRNDINFADLKRELATVFVVLPAERMRTHAAWLRCVVVSALRALYHRGGQPVLIMLDEFAALGHLGAVEDAFGLAAGYNVQLWPVLQDLNQLKALYRERWETFVANAGVVQGFAPNDLTTAE